MTSARPEPIKVSLKYLANDDNLASYVASVGGGDQTEHQGNYTMHSVLVHNGRKRQKGFALDREGFVLINSVSTVSDFYNDREIASIYETEIRSLVTKATNASHVEIFDHTRRSSSLEIQKSRGVRESASIVHNDYSAASGPARLRDYCSNFPNKVEKYLGNRFAIINVWRSIRGTVKNAPLTLCDASSTATEDLVPVTRHSKARVGELQLARHNPAHRWYYFPDMLAAECLLFKTFDSEKDGRARFTIHSSFNDPNASAAAPPRESIESRCFVFF